MTRSLDNVTLKHEKLLRKSTECRKVGNGDGSDNNPFLPVLIQEEKKDLKSKDHRGNGHTSSAMGTAEKADSKFNQMTSGDNVNIVNNKGSSTGNGSVTRGGSRRSRRKYVLTKRRKYWKSEEHERFLNALAYFGRNWKAIECAVATRTAIQIRSHAQKYFLRLERSRSKELLTIPPPRRKRDNKDGRAVSGKGNRDWSSGEMITKQRLMPRIFASPWVVNPFMPNVDQQQLQHCQRHHQYQHHHNHSYFRIHHLGQQNPHSLAAIPAVGIHHRNQDNQHHPKIPHHHGHHHSQHQPHITVWQATPVLPKIAKATRATQDTTIRQCSPSGGSSIEIIGRDIGDAIISEPVSEIAGSVFVQKVEGSRNTSVSGDKLQEEEQPNGDNKRKRLDTNDKRMLALSRTKRQKMYIKSKVEDGVEKDETRIRKERRSCSLEHSKKSEMNGHHRDAGHFHQHHYHHHCDLRETTEEKDENNKCSSSGEESDIDSTTSIDADRTAHRHRFIVTPEHVPVIPANPEIRVQCGCKLQSLRFNGNSAAADDLVSAKIIGLWNIEPNELGDVTDLLQGLCH